MQRRRVVVVGGGVAGLATAHHLRRRGAEVVVLEAAPRFGGRAVHDEREGYRIDAGPHAVGARDRELLALVAAAGLAERALPLRPLALAGLERGALRRLPEATPRGLLRLPGVSWLEALRLRRLDRLSRRFADRLDPSTPERAVRLDDRSAGDFARLYLGPGLLRHWIAPWLAADALADPEQTSRVLLWLLLESRRFAPLGRLRVGLGFLPAALADPGRDRVGVAVRRLRAVRGGLRAELEVGDPVEADAVVVATPAPAARALAEPLLTTPERWFLEAARSAPSLVLAAALEHSPCRDATRVRVPAEAGLAAASVTVEPGAPGGPAPEGAALAWVQGSAGWSAAHRDAADDVVEKALLAALERLFPGAERALRFTVLRRHAAALPRFDVGRIRALDRFRRVQGDRRAAGRRLYFAGDHLVAPSLEGAAASGRRAAEEVAADLALPPAGPSEPSPALSR